ncbi:DUF4062 domain-containing protein [Colwellia sp. MB3u-70]|uniref:DUF4062 domain-containing protein n=1 Tax=unclassified Colwellia TaxID=196834 RepID=UPI0015F50F7E|nr:MULTISPECIES: DUF4062 domain-containing protein [unclassified Colwellia]MBA6291058.1 DUF4062 domain-containing protein [Colwellia sp. MB3u-8]MBA6308223.1 DUF4062 domain-containing protein [Colwellia sp. MB3u-70]
MEKRYQVFVSSTYADLKEERQHVTQALMEMDCIPAGMELFPATDEEQWDFIKRIIDDCDYYLLIIGGRYGTTTDEGISYTEKEYDYAVDKGLKVIALLHEKPDEISVAKSDIAPELREKLQAFRDKVSGNRLVRFWSEAKELPGLVALSLSKTIKIFPATGWVRATNVSNEELLGELNELRKENGNLKIEMAKISKPESYDIAGLAGLEETFTVTGTYYTDRGQRAWESEITWLDIFSIISPYLSQNPSQDSVKETLKQALIKRDNINTRTNSLDDQVFQTIAVQFKALGLIKTNYTKTTKGGMAMFWSFTSEGEKLMVELRAVTSAQ